MGPDYCHAHRCPSPTCGVVWFHDPNALQDPKTHDQAHCCPKCGTEQRQVNAYHTFHMTMYRSVSYDPLRATYYDETQVVAVMVSGRR